MQAEMRLANVAAYSPLVHGYSLPIHCLFTAMHRLMHCRIHGVAPHGERSIRCLSAAHPLPMCVCVNVQEYSVSVCVYIPLMGVWVCRCVYAFVCWCVHPTLGKCMCVPYVREQVIYVFEELIHIRHPTTYHTSTFPSSDQFGIGIN
jgi:hypothetical protein